MQEEEKAAAPRVFDGFVDKLHHRLAAETSHASETEVACNENNTQYFASGNVGN